MTGADAALDAIGKVTAALDAAAPPQRTWEVHLWWTDGRGTFESGVVTMFPESWSAIQVVLEVAEWRDVDIGRVHCIDARRRDG